MPVGWKHSHAGVARKAVLRRRDPRHWTLSHRVKGTFDLPDLPRRPRSKGEVWAIFLVKNEIDILPHTLRHALTQGIDRILVVDNGSEDGTVEIVRNLTLSQPIHLGFDREIAYYQSHKMTHLARWATSRGADWIVPMDADEFWYAENESLADYLRQTPGDLAEARLYNLVPTVDHPQLDGLQGILRFDHSPHILRKTAVRAHPMVWLSMGNHEAIRPGLTVGGLYVAHLPWRSETQFSRKVRQGAAALNRTILDNHIGAHWRSSAKLSDAETKDAYRRLTRGQPTGEPGWNPVGPFSEVDPSQWKTWSPPLPPETGSDIA